MVQRVLVAYGSKYGATAEIAEAIAAALAQAGLSVDVHPARDVRTLQPYGAVVLGSAVYLGRWRRDASRLLRRPDLADRDVWLFSSGPAGPDPAGGFSDRWTTPKRVLRRAGQINAREHRVFGGRISAQSGGVMRRSMARNSPPELRDRRDWDEIRSWADTIAAAIADR